MSGLIVLFVTAYTVLAVMGAAAIVWQVVHPRRKTFAIALAQGLPTHPTMFGLKGEEVTFNLPGNHTTPGWIIEGKRPDGPTILLLHGHRDSIYGALRFADQLARYAAYVVTFDWPAHGGCSARWMTCGKHEPAAALAVLQGLPDEIRERPVALFGYSLGGQIAIKTAAEHPRFDGVIVDGAYRRWDTPIRLRLQGMRVPVFPYVHLAGLAFWSLGLIRNFDRAGYAARIEVPLLVIHGSDDRVCPIHEGRELADAAPDSTFIRIEAGRHNRLHDHDPEGYHSALSSFFDRL